MCTGNVIFPEDLPEDIVHAGEPKRDLLDDKMVDGNGLKDHLKVYEKALIETTLETCGGNRTHAAKALAISRRSLLYKLNEYRIVDTALTD